MKDLSQNRIIIITIPLTILIVVLLIDYYIVGSVIGLSFLFVGMIGMCRKEKFLIRFTKVLIVLLLFFILTNPAPQYWTSQFYRRWGDNRTELIEPNHPIMPSINSSFQNWFELENGFNFEQETDFEHGVRSIDEYIRLHRFNYTYDQIQYHGYYDHISTIDEILESEDDLGLWHDDCDGISILTTSFLIYLGYTGVYISEVEYHYHTMVFQEGNDPKTIEGYNNGISLYRGLAMQENDKISYYLFNQTEIFIPPSRPLLLSIGEILTDGSFWKFEFYEIFTGVLTGLPMIINFIIMLAAALLIGSALTIYSHIGITYRLKSNLRKNEGFKMCLLTSILLYGMFCINFLIARISNNGHQDISFLCNPILMISFIIVLFILDKKIKRVI